MSDALKSALNTLRIRADGGIGFQGHGYPLTVDEAGALLRRIHALEVELRKYDPSFPGITLMAQDVTQR